MFDWRSAYVRLDHVTPGLVRDHHLSEARFGQLPRPGRARVADILNRTAQDLGADMIVMGGFGHSRLCRRMFGGTKINMVNEAKVPVLLAH